MERNSSLEDGQRVEYIAAVIHALRNGSNVKGYFTWSFLDVYELLSGYSNGYGWIYLDLDDPDLKRYPKFSAKCTRLEQLGGLKSSPLLGLATTCQPPNELF
ncbi:unnamed protein product [Citrullus colocynthis]|uniref:Uncharacterized protein n=1 Tax=Citrullus colocynthis TaxID=252529 RepID=A0ABP0YU07_9ROSI